MTPQFRPTLLAWSTILVAESAPAQALPKFVYPAPVLAFAGRSMAPAPDVADQLPPRDDHAWDGLLVGLAAGAFLGLAINLTWESMAEEERSVGAWIGTFGVCWAVTVPVGLLIGGAIPKRAEPTAPGP